MAQANVTPIRKRSDEHPDKNLFRYVAEWHLARAHARVRWSSWDLQSEYGTTKADPDVGVSHYLERVSVLEQMIADTKPKTTYGAHVLLTAALEVLTCQLRDPDWTLAQGPVFEIVKNCTEALGLRDRALDGDNEI